MLDNLCEFVVHCFAKFPMDFVLFLKFDWTGALARIRESEGAPARTPPPPPPYFQIRPLLLIVNRVIANQSKCTL